MTRPTCGEENYHKQLINRDLIDISPAAPNAAERPWNSFPLQYSHRSWRPQYSRREPYIERARESYRGRSSIKGRTFDANTTRNKWATFKPSTPAIQQEKRNHNPTKTFIKNQEIGSQLYNVGSKRTGNENVKLSERGVTKHAQQIEIKSLGKNCLKNNFTVRKVGTCDKNERTRISDGTPEKGFKLTERGEKRYSEISRKDQAHKSGFESIEKNNATVRNSKRIYDKDEAIPKINEEKLLKRGETEQVEKLWIKSQKRHIFETNSLVKKRTVTCGENERRLKMNKGSPEKVLQRTEKNVVNQSEKCGTDQTETKDMKLSERTALMKDFKLRNNIKIHGKIETRSETKDGPPAKRLKLAEKDLVKLSERLGKEQTESNKTKSPGKPHLDNNSTMKKKTETSGKNETGPEILEGASKNQQSVPSEKHEMKLPEKHGRKSMEKNHFERPVNEKNKRSKCASSTLGSVAWSILSFGLVSDHENSSEIPTDREIQNVSTIETDFQKEVTSEISKGGSSEKMNRETLVPDYELSSVVSSDCGNYEDSQVKSTNIESPNDSTNESKSHRVERSITEDNFGISEIHQSEKTGNYVVAWKMKSRDTVQLEPDRTEEKEKLATTSPTTLSKRVDPRFHEGSIDSPSILRNCILISKEINKKLQDPRSRPRSNGQSNIIPLLMKVPDFWSRWRNKISKIKNKDFVCCRNLNVLEKYSNIPPEDMLSFCCHVTIKKDECKTASFKQLSDSRILSFIDTDKSFLNTKISKADLFGCDMEKTVKSPDQLTSTSTEDNTQQISGMDALLAHDEINKQKRKQKKLVKPLNGVVKKIDGISKKRCAPRTKSGGITSQSTTSSNILKNISEVEKMEVREINKKRVISDCNIDKRMVKIRKSLKLGRSLPPAAAVDDTLHMPESHISENNIDASFYDKLESDINKTSGSEKSCESSASMNYTASVNQDSSSTHDDVGSNHSDDYGCDMLIQVRVVDNPVPKIEIEEPVMGVEFFSVQPSIKSEQEFVQDGGSFDLSLANNLETKEIKVEDTGLMPKSPSTGIDADASSENVGEIVKYTSNTETEDIGEIAIHRRMQAAGNSSSNDTINVEQRITITGATANTTSIEESLLEKAGIIANHSHMQDAFSCDLKGKDSVTRIAETATSSSKSIPKDIKTSSREKVNNVSHVNYSAEKKETIMKATIPEKTEMNPHNAGTLTAKSVDISTKQPQDTYENTNRNIENATLKKAPNTRNLKTKVNHIEAETLSNSKEVPSQDIPKTSSNVINLSSTENVCETVYSSQKRDKKSLNATSTKEKRKGVAKISEVPTKKKSGMNPIHNDFPDKEIKEICKDRVNKNALSKNCNKDEAPNVSQVDRTNISHNSQNRIDQLNNTINPVPMVAEAQLTRMPILASIPTMNRKPQQPGLYAVTRYKIYKILNSYIFLSYQLVTVIESLKTIGQLFNMTPDFNHIKTTALNVRALHGSLLLDCLHSLTPRMSNSNLLFNSILLYLSQMFQNPKSKPMITGYVYELICSHGYRYGENETLRNFQHFIENDLAAQRPIYGRNITSEQYVCLRSQIFAYLTLIQGISRSDQMPDSRCNYTLITNPHAPSSPYNNSMSSPSPIATTSPTTNSTFLYPTPPISNVSSPPADINTDDNLRSTGSVQSVENMCNMEFPVDDVKPSPSSLAAGILKLKDEPDEIIDLTLLDENDSKQEGPEPAKDSVDESVELLILNNRKCLCGEPAEYLCACNTVMYCSELCQFKDWTNHKRVCSGVK